MTQHRLTDEQKYAAVCRAARVADPGNLTRTAAELLRTASHATVQTWIKRLRQRGYDMAEWDAAARAGRQAGPSMHKPKPAPAPPLRQDLRPAAEAPDHVLRRRTEWLADMKAIANEPGAIERLCDRWQCSRDVVYGRIGVLRNAGHDLTWWTHAPSRGFGDADAITAAASEVKPLPVVEIQAHASRYAAPVPWTMQAVAEIADVPLIKARFVARGLGIPFDTVLLNRPEALGLLSALGFSPRIAA